WYYGDNNEKVSWDDEVILTADEIDRGAVQTVSRPKNMKAKLKSIREKISGINAKEYVKDKDSLKNGAGKDDGMINTEEVDMEQKKVNIEDYKDLKLRDKKHSTD